MYVSATHSVQPLILQRLQHSSLLSAAMCSVCIVGCICLKNCVSIWECVLHLEHLIDATRHSLSLIKWTKMFTQQMLNSLVENVLNYFTDNFSETSFYLNFWSLLPPTKANFFSTTRMNLNTHCRCLPLSQCNGSVSVCVSGFGWNELTYAPHQIW